MCLGDFESMLIKVEDNETKEGLTVEEATGEGLGSALLWLLRNVVAKK